MTYRQHPLTKAQRKAVKQGRRNTATAYTRAQMREEVVRYGTYTSADVGRAIDRATRNINP